ncbi:MAG: ABC transporter ATP-binding protein [Prolixibacteraceae bacterium]|jgi:ABC-2 type transport system ATP-binding protein|nr:ABC transporter ATP-binding protein [Prolixibacteraceae bacterium]
MDISIQDLTKIYGNGHKALKSVNIEIENGMFGLLGANGAGKSTLMRILVSLMKPTSGKVMVNGMDLQKNRKAIRKMTGYLPQDFSAFPKLKTWEFLDYSARLGGVKNKRERRDAVDEMLEEVGLYEARERYANNLSGGMKRRLGIAQTLIGNPKIIIVDEPTTGLDPDERIRFRNLLTKISSRDVIIILSTHIVGDISSTCHQMALLRSGKLVYKGSPEVLMNEAKGKVWRVKATHEQFDEANIKFNVISTIPTANGWELEVVAESVNGYPAEPIVPNLEHAYVYYMEYKTSNLLNL